MNNKINMKKQNIIIISVIVILIIVGCVFFFMGKKSGPDNELIPQENDNEGTSIASLAIGNWASIVAEKSNGSYTALMIMVCESKENCSTKDRNRPSGENMPTGEAPTGNPPSNTGTVPSGEAPTGKREINMENKSMLSGTITEINSDSIVLSLDTGETATVLISDSTRINKR